MSVQHVQASITIGGTILRRTVIPLCELLTDAGVQLDWAEPFFVPGGRQHTLAQCITDLGEALGSSLTLTLVGNEVPLGAFGPLEAFLKAEQIPFDRHSDPTENAPGELVRFRSGLPLDERAAGPDGDVLVPARALRPLLAQLEALPLVNPRDHAADLGGILRDMKTLCGDTVPPLPPFQIAPARGR